MRIVLNLTEADVSALDALADLYGCSREDALRLAVADELIVTAAMRRGGKVILKERDDTFRVLSR